MNQRSPPEPLSRIRRKLDPECAVVGANDPVQPLLPVLDLADRAHGEERAIEIGEQLVGGVALVEEIERRLD